MAGYQAWQKNLTRQVKVGKKEYRLLHLHCTKKKQEIEKIDPVTRRNCNRRRWAARDRGSRAVIPRFRVTTVFDVSQTTGEPIAELEVSELMEILFLP